MFHDLFNAPILTAGFTHINELFLPGPGWLLLLPQTLALRDPLLILPLLLEEAVCFHGDEKKRKYIRRNG